MNVRRSVVAAAALAGLALVGNAVSAGTLSPVGPEFTLNSLLSYVQKQPWIACDQHGNFVMVYSQDDIYFRRFDRDGNPLGPDTKVNPTIKNSTQDEPYVAMDPVTGDFVIGWSDRNGNDGFDMGCGIRFYRADGTPYGPEFFCHTVTAFSQFEPHMSYSTQGRVMVVWADAALDGVCGVFARIFDRDGTPLTGQFLVNAPNSASQIDPTVSCDQDGRFVIAYVDASGQTGPAREVLARLYDNDGNALTAPFLVNSTSAGMQRDPNVVMAFDGSFVVTFVDESGLDGDKFGVFARRFDKNGVAQGPQFLVNQTTTGDQRDPQVWMDHVGNFTICWEDNTTGTDSNVMARRYDRFGAPLSNEFVLHANTAGNQYEPKVACSRSGQRLIALWAASTTDVHGRIFDLETIVPSGPAAIGTTIQLGLDLPGVGNETYLLMASLGSTPGLPLSDGRTLPLNFDALMQFTIQFPNTSLFGGLTGTLTPSGAATATFSVPNTPVAVGVPITFAAITLNPPNSTHIVHALTDARVVVIQ